MSNLFHRVTLPPPPSSAEAAAIKKRASRLAVAAVRTLLSDGRPRTDEEIAEEVVRVGAPKGRRWSADTCRHARLALLEAKVIKWTGEVRITMYGRPSQLWVLAEPLNGKASGGAP